MSDNFSVPSSLHHCLHEYGLVLNLKFKISSRLKKMSQNQESAGPQNPDVDFIQNDILPHLIHEAQEQINVHI